MKTAPAEPTKFAERAGKLIQQDCTAAVFGGWTSSSRKAMLPAREPMMPCRSTRCSTRGWKHPKNIFYTGATTNQQIIPPLDYLAEKGTKSIFPVGSHYVFPRTANKIIQGYAAAHGMKVLARNMHRRVPRNFSTIVNKSPRFQSRCCVQHSQR